MLWRPFGPKTSSNFSVSTANSTYFTSRQPYFEQFTQRITSWTLVVGEGGGGNEEIRSFLDEQWTLHTQELTTIPIYIPQHQTSSTMASLRRDSSSWRSWTSKIDSVLSHLYFQGCLEYTWNDPELFRRLPLTYDEAQGTIERSIPTRFRRGTNGPSIPSFPCHYGYVFLKGRNNSRKAVLWFPTFEADMGDFFRLQHAPLTPCCYNSGPKPWVS